MQRAASSARLRKLPSVDEVLKSTTATAAVERFGRIDVLLNNAGFGLLGAVEEATAAEVERLYRDVRCGGFHPASDALTHESIGKATLGIDPTGPRW